MVKREVEIETLGECVDEIDKLAELIGGDATKAVVRSLLCYASYELNLHVFHVVADVHFNEYTGVNSSSTIVSVSPFLFLLEWLQLDSVQTFDSLVTPSSVFEAKQVVLFQRSRSFFHVVYHH
ncbi:hypothetical protein Tco_1112879 [Tanacetum coccineum]|uniref:Uncharacterized protein n=1 Tax=Tanacetum coccineum TaxID=301880 RepID=A0ABQ5IRT9_9ASTR